MPAGARSAWAAFARGTRLIVSVPAFVLLSTTIGFGALARDGGFELGHAVFVTVTTFALPNQVLLIDQLMRGATLAGAALAVTLAAVRLMPMTVTLVPLIRGVRRRRLLEVVAVHFVAISTWIEGNRRLAAMPVEERLPFHLGVGAAMLAMMLTGTVAGYMLVAGMPPLVNAALIFTTPLYFFLSLLATSRSRMDFAAVALGCTLTPLLYMIVPGLDLLLGGVVGGTVAFLLGRTR